jgi:hypothetical protein|tara:strand:- start:2397 stop:2594 length:198 start_codon:yes stop_codon:yes gene_type:complete
MMSNVELQKKMLKYRMSIVDIAMSLHVTKDQVKRFVNGKEEIPEWVEVYFGDLDEQSKRGTAEQS